MVKTTVAKAIATLISDDYLTENHIFPKPLYPRAVIVVSEAVKLGVKNSGVVRLKKYYYQ